MKYILGVGLEFNWYKGKTNIRLFSDNTFIHEIELDNHIHTTEKLNVVHDPAKFNSDPMHKKNDLTFSKNRPNSLPNKLFLFEINESHLGEKISFEMKDENTNYTNGFMTKSNLVKFQTIFLMPKCSLKNENYSRLLAVLQKRFNKYDPFEAKGYIDYGPWKAFTIDWPNGTNFLYDQDNENVQFTWIGGNRTCHVHLRKKFHVHHIWPGGTKNAGHPTVQGQPSAFINYVHYYNLINIFNEDQRSNNTKD